MNKKSFQVKYVKLGMKTTEVGKVFFKKISETVCEVLDTSKSMKTSLILSVVCSSRSTMF